jgi:acyl dehydratase
VTVDTVRGPGRSDTVMEFASVDDAARSVGADLGVSDWVELGEEELQDFGRITGDTHWIHVDPARAGAEGPFGSVIVHGFLTLSLVTALAGQCYTIASARRWVNYGLDRVRFVSPLLPRTPVRLELRLDGVEPKPDGGRLRLGCRIVTADGTPVMVATWLVHVVEQEKESA